MMKLYDGFRCRKSEKKAAKELAIQQQGTIDSELWNAQYEALCDTKNDFRYERNMHYISVLFGHQQLVYIIAPK